MLAVDIYNWPIWKWDGWGVIESVAVVGALFAAAYTLRLQWTAGKERDDDQRRRDDEKRVEQASRVAVYPTTPFPANGKPRYTRAAVTNGNVVPITGVTVWLQERDPLPAVGLTFIEVIPGGRTCDEIPFRDRDIGRDQSAELWVRFTDSAGIVWRKSGVGEPRIDDPDDPPPDTPTETVVRDPPREAYKGSSEGRVRRAMGRG